MPLTNLSPEGLYVETYDETRARMVERVRSDISQTANVEEESYLGNLLSIVATAARETNEALQAVFSSFDPDANGGAAQDHLAAVTGTTREDATFSTTLCEIVVDPGAYPAGTLISHVQGNPAARFENAQDVTNATPGALTVTVLFRAQERGPVAAPAGTLNVIAGAVLGWQSVTNPEDADLGRDVELDSELRARRESELFAGGSTSVDAIQGALTREIQGVEFAFVVENTSDETSGEGLPPHSIEAIVIAPAVDPADIARVIWNTKAGGILAHGQEQVVITDSQGFDQVVGFSYAEELDLYVRATIECVEESYVGDTEFVRHFVEAANLYYQLGRDVRVSKLIALCHQVPGVFGVVTIETSTDGVTWSSANRAISYRERARFDTGRTTVTSSFVLE